MVKDLGITVSFNLKFSQQCNESVKKANRMMGLIKRKFSLKNKDFVLPLYNSFVRPPLEHVMQVWSPHHAKDITYYIREDVQCRAINKILSLQNKPYKKNLFSLEKC